ncbi:MAG: protoporphyrinogen/coproporphyrinogen oxidase [Acidobacteriota bacterium]
MSGVVIIGAGLTGLSAAWHMRQSALQPLVLEAEDRPGGACRTLERDGFSFDLTGHLLHLGREESRILLGRLGVLSRMRRHRRRAGIALAGAVTPYPIQIHTHKLPPAIRRECLLGFLEARLAGEPAETPATFAEWVTQRFGAGFARHFFFPYNSKLFCAAPETMSADWVGRYVPRPALADVVDGALGLFPAARAVGYNAAFLYPKVGGISMLPEALAAASGPVRYGAAVRRLHLGDRSLELECGEVLGFETLIATVSLRTLASITEDLPADAAAAAAALRAVGVVNVNLGVRGKAPRREHWLYVPEGRFPFYRVGIPSNHGSVAPDGCHTLSVEVSLPTGSPVPADLFDSCLAGLESLGLLRDRKDVETVAQERIDPAYVVFDAARPPAVAAIRDTYRRAGVILSGRWAEWKYSTMEDALWDGATAARRVAP